MPTRKSYSKINKYKKYMDVGHKALQIALATKKLLNVEYKFKDTDLDFVDVKASSTILAINGLSQGTSVSTREGDQVKFTSLNIKYWVSFNPAAAFSFVRIMLILDKQPNKSLPLIDDILQDVSSGNMATVTPLQNDNKRRFRNLYDKTLKLSPSSNATTQYREKYMKLDTRTLYSGNAGDISDITTNSFLFVFLSNEVLAFPSLTSYIRMRYVDN